MFQVWPDGLESKPLPVLDVEQTVADAVRLGLPTDFISNANTLTLRTGREPSTAHLLMSKDTLDLMNLDIPVSIHLSALASPQIQTINQDLDKEDTLKTITINKMVIDEAKAVIPGHSSGVTYLVKFVDYRALFNRSHIDKSYNLIKAHEFDKDEPGTAKGKLEFYDRSLHQPPGSSGRDPYTYGTMLRDLWDRSPVVPTYPTELQDPPGGTLLPSDTPTN